MGAGAHTYTLTFLRFLSLSVCFTNDIHIGKRIRPFTHVQMNTRFERSFAPLLLRHFAPQKDILKFIQFLIARLECRIRFDFKLPFSSYFALASAKTFVLSLSLLHYERVCACVNNSNSYSRLYIFFFYLSFVVLSFHEQYSPFYRCFHSLFFAAMLYFLVRLFRFGFLCVFTSTVVSMRTFSNLFRCGRV